MTTPSTTDRPPEPPKPTADLPGAAPVPFLGPLANAARFSRDVLGSVDSLFRDHGPFVAMVRGDVNRHPKLARWVFTFGPEFNREIIGRPDDFHKPPLNKQLSPAGTDLSEREQALRRWGAGLFNIQGETHRLHRRLLMPAFHHHRLAEYRDDIVALTEAAIAGWERGQIRDIKDDMMRLTLLIAAKCLLGEDVRGEGEHTISHLIQRTLHAIIRPSVFLLPWDVPGLPYRSFVNDVWATDVAMRSMIRERRAAGAPGGDILSLLLHARDEGGAALEEDHLIEHAGVTFIAGHETSSNALTWTLFLLGQHAELAASVHEELDQVLGGSAPTMEQLSALPLLDRVVTESMRLMPPVPLNARVVGRDCVLHGQPLAAGTQVVMSIYHTHRMPEFFPQPQRFDPARWEGLKVGGYEYTPFSAGPRRCIGAAFATVELKLILAVLLQRVRLEPVPGTQVDRLTTITLSIRGQLPMVVRAQDRAFGRGAGGVRGTVREMVDLGD